MKKYPKRLLIVTLFVLALLLSACNLPVQATPQQIDPNLLHTVAAQTVQAQLTQAADKPLPTQPVAPTQTSAPLTPTSTQAVIVVPTNTSAPTFTFTPAPPTNTPVPPTETPAPIPCDRASFVEDVTFPDNAEVAAGITFIKTWRLKNNGSCTWNSSYSLVFDSGDAMGAQASVQLTTGTVAPGEALNISVSLKAPDAPKTYQGYWKLRNGGGVVFGIGAAGQSAFWVKVKVVSVSTPTPTQPPSNVVYDLVDKGPSAEWRNGSGLISWGDPEDDSPGVAVNLKDVKLENGSTYAKALATYPQWIDNGMISGLFPAYTVQSGDRFRAYLGFRADCGIGKVKYQLKYREGATDTLLGEWIKSCDGAVLAIEKDLSSLAGKSIQLILIVSAEGTYKEDRAVWANPRIER